jgi:hypothetical protein
MHMAPRAAAWVAWVVWTCNTPHRVTVEESGPLARFFFMMCVLGTRVDVRQLVVRRRLNLN